MAAMAGAFAPFSRRLLWFCQWGQVEEGNGVDVIPSF